MAVDPKNLLAKYKANIGITWNDDDTRLLSLITEGIYYLQQFRTQEFVDTVEDEETEKLLNPLETRIIFSYVTIRFDGDPSGKLQQDIQNFIDFVRDK